jgi:hypothetical protein
MLHLIWYIIVGFLAGCVAKALLHVHLSINVDNCARHRGLDYRRRSDTHLLAA